ncbi:hypothetical protein I3760_16G083300 [Carya illinoinensis]|nr:hypothetical protein I3760_16G083300 [Carya illinoinensis]
MSRRFKCPSNPKRNLGASQPTFASRQKQLLLKISNKAVGFMGWKRIGNYARTGSEREEWGDCGVWQKAILMGDKCEPLDFSGVIYYDSNGTSFTPAVRVDVL